MPIRFESETACLEGHVGVDEAEALLSWLQGHPDAAVDLSACTHVHASSLQVLLAADRVVRAWPGDEGLAEWMRPAITDH